VANTLAYYDTTTITAEKRFIVVAFDLEIWVTIFCVCPVLGKRRKE
jgi:hypothetical protein